MNHLSNHKEGTYELLILTEQHIPVLYQWTVEEKHFDNYTCRPRKPCQSLEEYTLKVQKAISEETMKTYVLVRQGVSQIPLGKITLFDINPRNHSAEFGYYLPDNHRSHGYGSILLSEFMKASFQDEDLNLNKLYATTSSNNLLSIKLLEKFGFHLDGRLREHYWIKDNRYDQLIYSLLKNEWISTQAEGPQ